MLGMAGRSLREVTAPGILRSGVSYRYVPRSIFDANGPIGLSFTPKDCVTFVFLLVVADLYTC